MLPSRPVGDSSLHRSLGVECRYGRVGVAFGVEVDDLSSELANKVFVPTPCLKRLSRFLTLHHVIIIYVAFQTGTS